MKGVKSPTIMQMEAEECGAASLSMVLAHYGRHVRLEDMRIECGVSRDGATASNILKGARRHGLIASAKRLELARLAEIRLPAIVFVNMNHFVVLEAVSETRYRLNDPAVGRRVVDSTEFDEMFTGITLLFEPGPDFQTTQKPPNKLRVLAEFLSQDHTAATLILLSGLALILPGLAIPAFSKAFVDGYLMDGQKDWIFWIGLLMVSVIALQTGLMWIRSLCSAKLEAKLALTLNTKLVWRLMRLPIPFFGQRFAGALAGRGLMATRLAKMAGRTSLSAILEAFTLAFFVLVMASYSLEMTAVVVFLFAAAGSLLFLLQRRMEQLSVKTAIEQMKLNGKTMVGLQTIESIKSSGTETKFFEGWAGTHANVVNGQAGLAVCQAFLGATPGFVSFFGKAMTLVIGGFLVMDGRLTIGSLVAFQALMAAADMPFRTLVDDIQELVQVQGPINQVKDIIEYPEAAEFRTAAPPGHMRRSNTPDLGDAPARLSGAIRIKDLSFGYSRLSDPLLSGFHLDVEPGRRIALVGSSGSGKSTLAKLLTGAYPAWNGEIAFDGKAIDHLQRSVLRNSLAVVDQNIMLFETNYRENIRLWDTTISEDEIVQAAKDAEIHDFIAGTKQGYDTRVEENGRNMSGGQRQRVEIARAIARDSSILVLDEATSALDPVVEAKVMANITRRGTTCIIIAHRLSTIRDCDEILVLERGVVVQRGTHDAMLAIDGPYRQLIAA